MLYRTQIELKSRVVGAAGCLCGHRNDRMPATGGLCIRPENSDRKQEKTGPAPIGQKPLMQLSSADR